MAKNENKSEGAVEVVPSDVTNAAAMANAMDFIVQNADQFDAQGFEFESFISLGEGKGIGGRFLGMGATIVKGFDGKPCRLPVAGVRCTVYDPETGEFMGEVTAKMIASSNLYSQLSRVGVGDDVTVMRIPGTTTTRSGFHVKRFNVGRRPNLNPLDGIPDGLHPYPVAVAALAEAGQPETMADEALPADSVARAVAKVLSVVSAGMSVPALPAATTTTTTRALPESAPAESAPVESAPATV